MKYTIRDKILLQILSIKLLFLGYAGKGLTSNSINNLVNVASDYDEIHPLLMRWLMRFSKETHGRSVLVRILGDSKDIKYVKFFIDEYENSRNLYYKSDVATTIFMINKFDKESIDRVMKLVLERQDNNARCYLLQYLSNSRDPRVTKLLEKIYTDKNETEHMRKTAGYLLKHPGKGKRPSPAYKRAIQIMEK